MSKGGVNLVRQQESGKVSVGDVFEEMTGSGFIKQFTVTDVDPTTGRYYISEPVLKGTFHEGMNRHARRKLKSMAKKIKNKNFADFIKPNTKSVDTSDVNVTEGEGLVGPTIEIGQ